MKTFWRLMSYVWPYKGQYLVILLLGITASILQPGAALAVKPLLDGILLGKNPELLKVMPMVIIIFTLVCGLSRYVYSVWAGYLSEVIIRHLRLQLYQKYLDLSFDYYSKASTGRLFTALSSDVVLLLEGISRVTSLFRDPFTIVGLLAVSFYRDWKLTLLALLITPPLIYMVVAIGKKLKKMTHTRQDQWANLNSTVYETLSGIRIIKAFNLEKKLKQRFQQDNDRLLNVQYRWMLIENISSPVLYMIGGFGVAFLTIYGGGKILSQGATGGDILSVGLALGLLIDPIKKIEALNLGFQKALGGAERIFKVFDLEPSIKNSPDAVVLKPFQKNITFQNVSFQYDDQKDWVLKNVSVNVQKGEALALVGSSGAGKTTFVNLIPRFYDVVEGSISIDGMDLRDVTMHSLRDQISIVSQDVFLFNDTVLENIAYGKQDRTREEVIQAAKAANAHEFILNLPEGYDSTVGERGVKLSGGQRQRISIARALLKNAPILILDEATSALDTESEILVQQAIEKLMQGRTSFVIAHRLSTVQNASRILVLEQGQIQEEGTHDILIAKKGLYYKLYQLQFSKKLGAVQQGESQIWQ